MLASPAKQTARPEHDAVSAYLEELLKERPYYSDLVTMAVDPGPRTNPDMLVTRHAAGAWQLVRDDVSVAGAGLPGDRRAPVGAGGHVQAAAIDLKFKPCIASPPRVAAPPQVPDGPPKPKKKKITSKWA